MPEELPIVSEEEQELLTLWEKYARFPKLYRWLTLYFDKTNTQKLNTYLDGTESAFIAYNISRENEQYAWEIASRNTSKYKLWAQRYYAIKGITKEKTLDMIAAHASVGKPKAIEIMAVIMDIYDPKSFKITQNNIQINNNVQISPEDQDAMDKEFSDFIDFKYGKKAIPTTDPEASEVVSG